MENAKIEGPKCPLCGRDIEDKSFLYIIGV